VAYAIVFLLLGFARASGTKARVSAGLGALAAATSLLAMGGARWAGDRHLNLPPALQSVWFVPHVLVYAVAYGVLGLAGLTGLTFVILRYTAWRSPGGMMRAGTMPQVMDELGYALMAVGFAFLSMGLLFGCFWAQVAWGAWWGWDAKETWALIAWLVYLLYFHARRLPGWKGLLSAWFAFAGAAAVLVCFLLFEYLPASSLHRYT
jgi:ABC-type transport system involved in cytochrome c biogenesis permease subunit